MHEDNPWIPKPDVPARAEPPDPNEGFLVQDPDVRRMREADAEIDRALDPFGAVGMQRLKMYVLGAVIFFPLATWLFTPAGFQSLWFQLLVAAAYGAFIALKRPTGYLSVLAAILAGLAIQTFTGHGSIGFGFLMAMMFYGFIGALVGLGELSRIIDGR